MKIMGSFYRDYFGSLGLPGGTDCSTANRAYFWADTAHRTMDSARALAESMLPGCAPVIHSAGGGQGGEGKRDPMFEGDPPGPEGLAAVAGRLGPDLNALSAAHRPALDLLARVLNGNGKARRSIFDDPVTLSGDDGGVSMAGPLSLASTLSEDFLLEYTEGMTGGKFGWGRLDIAASQTCSHCTGRTPI